MRKFLLTIYATLRVVHLYGLPRSSERTLNREIWSKFDFDMNIFRFSLHLEVDFNPRTDIFPSIHLQFSFCRKEMTIYIYSTFLLAGNARGGSWSLVFRVFCVPERNRRPAGNCLTKGAALGAVDFVLSRQNAQLQELHLSCCTEIPTTA